MVAIVGGLLVSRFVSIDTTQQVAKQRFDSIQVGLKAADEKLLQFRREATWQRAQTLLLNKKFLTGLLQADDIKLSHLRTFSGAGPLSDDQLEEVASRVQPQLHEAAATLPRLMSQQAPGDWGRLPEWHEFRNSHAGLASIQLPWAWGHVYDAFVALGEPLPRNPKPSRLLGPQSPLMDAITSGGLDIASDWVRQQGAARTDAAERDTVQQELYRDGLDRQYQQAYQDFLDASADDRLLRFGLIVLIYYTLAGVVYPIYLLRGNPQSFTATVNFAFWLFCTGLGALLVYTIWLAWRLSNAKRSLVVERWSNTTAE